MRFGHHAFELCEASSRRLMRAWVDLLEHGVPAFIAPQYLQKCWPHSRRQRYSASKIKKIVGGQRTNYVTYLAVIERQLIGHGFHFRDILKSLILLVQAGLAGLTETQRKVCYINVASTDSDAGVFRYWRVRRLFMDWFCVAQIGVDVRSHQITSHDRT